MEKGSEARDLETLLAAFSGATNHPSIYCNVCRLPGTCQVSRFFLDYEQVGLVHLEADLFRTINGLRLPHVVDMP